MSAKKGEVLSSANGRQGVDFENTILPIILTCLPPLVMITSINIMSIVTHPKEEPKPTPIVVFQTPTVPIIPTP